jgi:hypothetical protein
MYPELTDGETAALLDELDRIIDGDRYFLSERIKTIESDPRQDRAGTGARAIASAAEAICTTTGDSEAETARGAVSLPGGVAAAGGGGGCGQLTRRDPRHGWLQVVASPR